MARINNRGLVVQNKIISYINVKLQGLSFRIFSCQWRSNFFDNVSKLVNPKLSVLVQINCRIFIKNKFVNHPSEQYIKNKSCRAKRSFGSMYHKISTIMPFWKLKTAQKEAESEMWNRTKLRREKLK